ncbi:MAG: hypothetical protein K6B52_08240 [Clostridiales bacterium]|nr:hypothetical protein [Clostridiales bacterium]
MKTCKKALAVMLSLLMAFTALGISACAENVTKWYVPVSVTNAKAVAFKDGDPKTVTRLELTVVSNASAGSEAPADPFDTFDPNAEITIYEGTFISVSNTVAQILGKEADNAFADAVIAKAKPVAFANGVLTLDVFSKNGETGAKMFAIQIDNFETGTVSEFYFDFPEEMLSLSSGTKYSKATRTTAHVDGLQSEKLELPSLIRRMFSDFSTGKFGALIGKVFLILPIALLLVPILMKSLENNAQKVYNNYGINVHSLFSDAQKAVRKILPYFINQIFGAKASA